MRPGRSSTRSCVPPGDVPAWTDQRAALAVRDQRVLAEHVRGDVVTPIHGSIP